MSEVYSVLIDRKYFLYIDLSSNLNGLIEEQSTEFVSSSQTLFSSESEVKMGDEVASLLAIFNSFKKSG